MDVNTGASERDVLIYMKYKNTYCPLSQIFIWSGITSAKLLLTNQRSQERNNVRLYIARKSFAVKQKLSQI